MLKLIRRRFGTVYVQEVKVQNQRKYLLIDSEGNPITPVVKYLKYLEQTGKSHNTLKTYCYGLKHYFTFLEERIINKLHYKGWLSLWLGYTESLLQFKSHYCVTYDL